MPREYPQGSYQYNIKAALEYYPKPQSAFRRWRSAVSIFTADYLVGQLEAGIDEVALKDIVNFLLTGKGSPKNKPAQLRQLSQRSLLRDLLDTAQKHPIDMILGDDVRRKLDYYDGTGKALATDTAAACFMDLSIRRKYDAAIQSWISKRPEVVAAPNLEWERIRHEETLATLGRLTRDEHLFNVDLIWQDIIELHEGRRSVQSMIDPPHRDPRAFPSSSHLSRAFSLHGYAFRCDTRPPDSVTKYGFRRLYEFACPDEIRDTFPHKVAIGRVGAGPQLGMWKKNRDAVSEMTICVSRQLRGCTKFPGPLHAGNAWIYALGLPPSKLGYDTEEWQAGFGGDALWRPGEKAFYDLKPQEILASVPILKALGEDAPFGQPQQLWKFTILSDRWTFYHANAQQKQHLNQELQDLYHGGQQQSILEGEDFALAA